MSSAELFITAIGLSMDAFAVALCMGVGFGRFTLKNALIIGCYFGGFQALMPLIGYFAASFFAEYIQAFDHWLVFGLLLFIGARMIFESFSTPDREKLEKQPSISPKKMLPFALATSIDALGGGITFAFLNVNIIPAVALIGVITFVLSAAGVGVGAVFGLRFRSKAEFAGGVVLIFIGVKVLLEHLGVI